jgi:acyl-CoA synthetase (AMP-forming)/AMP-acid ligase II
MSGLDAPQPCFSEILALHGKWLGAKPALVTDTRTISWSEFDAAQNRVANGLVALGLAPGDRVALVMDNSAEMVEAMFGIVRAGGVMVPLNLAVSAEGMAAMLADSAVGAIFVSAPHAGKVEAALRALPSLRPGGMLLQGGSRDGWTSYEPWRDGQDSANPGVAINPDDPFHIIYSSGTTGLPKGIVHSERRRRALIETMCATSRIDTRARTLISIGMYSNISLVSLQCTLMAGGTLHIKGGFDPADTLATIGTRGITHLLMVPIMFQLLWEHADFVAADLSSLTCLLSVGAPLHVGLKQKIIARVGEIVIEAYGLTEGPITVIDGADCARLPGSVGKPLYGTDIRIIDAEGHEVQAGADGEIVGRGPHNMTGYHNKPEATAEATWISPEGEKWLRTGDLGRLDADGFLYIVGRIKDMIISGGQNIYPSDIEAVLITHPGVNDCAVIGIPHERWGETPLAIVVPEPGKAAEAQEIAAWVNERVGKRQRVAGVAFADSLPRNPNGKILKRVLREPYWP